MRAEGFFRKALRFFVRGREGLTENRYICNHKLKRMLWA